MVHYAEHLGYNKWATSRRAKTAGQVPHRRLACGNGQQRQTMRKSDGSFDRHPIPAPGSASRLQLSPALLKGSPHTRAPSSTKRSTAPTLLSEEFAREYSVPLEAMREALEYAANNMALIEAERDREAADVRARHLDRPVQS